MQNKYTFEEPKMSFWLQFSCSFQTSGMWHLYYLKKENNYPILFAPKNQFKLTATG
jgi:hypothetical protein